LTVYKGVSDETSRRAAGSLGVSVPVANRAIAPTGTIGLVAGTTTGIEPVYAVAYKRRYLKGTRWHYQFAVDHVAQTLVNQGHKPDDIESAIDLAEDYERRIRFQADVQDYVDMAISSTINLPAYGTESNTPDLVEPFARTLALYAPRLRGFTCYPDGGRGGQPLTSVPYAEAVGRIGAEFEESLEVNDVCDITGTGHCGL
jgi:ribonucleoside-diphosphate reductase alpha chain